MFFFQIYCGHDFCMCHERYLDAVNKASTSTTNEKKYSTFVKSVAVTIVELADLKASSVKGRRCNRFKNSVPKKPIEPAKLKAIYGKCNLFTFYR